MFFAYIASLALAVMTAWLYGRSTDRYVEEIHLKAAENERQTEVLKKDNLTLSSELNAEKGKVAGLQKAAADAQRDLSEQKGKTAALETAASAAKQQLAEQQGRTAILERAASDAKAEMARQQERAANLERLTSEARTELARQQARAAEAEKSLLELKELTKHRWLTDEERRIIIAEAQRFPWARVTIRCIFLNPESCDFAKQIANTLRLSTWIVDGPTGVAAEERGRPLRGIRVYVRDLKNPPAHAFPLDWALARAGYPSRPDTDETLSADDVVLVIGVR